MSFPIPPTPPTPEQSRQARIKNVEERRVQMATTKPFYLAAPDVVKSLRWYQSGRSHVLVDSSVTDDTPIYDVRPAVLSVVGQIDSKDLFVRSDMWKPSTYTPTLADQKLKLKFGRPIGFGPGVEADFNSACKALAALEKKGVVVATPTKTSIIHPSTTVAGDSLIQLRHVLFSPKDLPVVDEDVSPGAVPDPQQDAAALATYNINNWPFTTAEAQAAIVPMKDTHVLNVPAFYDMHFRLLNPSQYQKSLEGAVAEIQFTLTHHLIGKGKDLKNVFTADVHEVLIIYGAPPRLITPRRHHIWAVHPSSPTKKRKLSN